MSRDILITKCEVHVRLLSTGSVNNIRETLALHCFNGTCGQRLNPFVLIICETRFGYLGDLFKIKRDTYRFRRPIS